MSVTPTGKPAARPALRWAAEFTLIVVTYCLSAWFLVKVQTGMGAAHLVWLPAGIALTAVLWRDRAALPAIFIAILCVHYTSLFATQAVPIQAFATAAITSFGATLQAWVTAWLLKSMLRDFQITRVSDALVFVMCAAVGASISATVGTLTLLHQDRISSDAFSLTLMSWWVGDLSGMLVVAPLALVARHWRRKRREWSLLSLPIIGLGCSFTLVTAFIVKHLDHDARVNEFVSNGIVMGQALQRSLEISQHDLLAADALFYNIAPNDTEFRNFSLRLLKHNNLLYSVGWAPLLTHNQRRAFEAKTGVPIIDRLPDGREVPAIEADEYLPLQMSVPAPDNRSVFGFNLLSEPGRRSAIAVARTTTEAQATRLVELVRGGRAILVYQPIYRNEYQPDGSLPDDKNLRGFVVVAVKIARIAEEALRPFEGQQAETWLVDVTDADAPQLLYHHIGGTDMPPDDASFIDVNALRQGLYQETAHNFAGRDWVLISQPHGIGGTLKATGQFVGILVGGFSLTLILALYMIGRQRSEHEMQARDERLMSQNAVLTQLAHVGLSPETDGDEQIRELLATSAVTLRLERVSLWRLEREQGIWRCVALFTRSSGEFSANQTLDAAAMPNYLAALKQGRALVVSNVKTDPRTLELAHCYAQYGVASIMDIPLRIGGQIDGVVSHEHVGPMRTWAPDEQNFASSIGDLAALVIESTRRRHAEHALQESYQALEAKVEQRTEELREANERLRQLDRLKSMFIASMSHELRTPLNAIIGFTGVVLQGIAGPLNPKQTDHLNRVHAAGRHLLSLITDVIDISKIEAGYADVYLETIQLTQLIEEAIATVQPQRVEKGLDIELSAPGAIVVRSDRKRLVQCVLNLLSNAVKYSESGTIAVRLRDEGERIAIEVEDSGIGIPPEAMERLFQPFERIDTHLRVKTLGTGLGLYLTKKITTELLHGDIAVASTPGKGSTFTLRLPATPPSPTQGVTS